MELTDSAWALVEPHLSGPKKWKPGGRGRPPRPARSILEGILWVMRTGAPWHDMPNRYPSYATCFRRFEQWRGDGELKEVLAILYEDLRRRGKTNDVESFIDGTYVEAKGGGLCVGRSRAGKSTKVMAIADGSGLPRSVSIADGNRHDVSLVDQTLDDSFTDDVAPLLIGDKAFDSWPLAVRLASERDVELLAPVRGGPRPSTRRQDGRKMRRYQRRWKVECLFAWLKRWRRICTRWERKAENFLGFIHLGCIVILLRHLKTMGQPCRPSGR